jgi:hypothetical protein
VGYFREKGLDARIGGHGGATAAGGQLDLDHPAPIGVQLKARPCRHLQGIAQ